MLTKIFEKDSVQSVVVPVGSCRIYQPLSLLRDAGSIELLTPKIGYVHTSKEILQSIKVAKGLVEIPYELWPFVVGKEFPAKRPMQDACVLNTQHVTNFVVEVSSRKVCEFRGYYLQNNLLRNRLFVEPDIFDSWVKEQLKGNYEPHNYLDRIKICGVKEIDRISKNIVLESRSYLDTFVDIRLDLIKIQDLLKGFKLLVTTHCRAHNKEGKLVASRSALIDFIVNYCYEADVNCLNPSTISEEIGQETTFLRNGMETNHYTTKFQSLVSERIESLLG